MNDVIGGVLKFGNRVDQRCRLFLELNNLPGGETGERCSNSAPVALKRVHLQDPLLLQRSRRKVPTGGRSWPSWKVRIHFLSVPLQSSNLASLTHVICLYSLCNDPF